MQPLINGKAAMCGAALVAAAVLLATPAMSFAERGRGRGGPDRHKSPPHARAGHHGKDKPKLGISVHISGRRHFRHHRPYHRFHRPGRYCRPGYYRRVWVPPVYETRRRGCGTVYRVLVRPGCFRRIWVPSRCSYPHHRHGLHRRGRGGGGVRFHARF